MFIKNTVEAGVLFRVTYSKYVKAQSHWGTIWHGHTRKEQKPRSGNQRP